jgi:hypothetical protein
MFAEEKPFLQPLPLEPFRYYQYGERTVHLDGCVEVEAAYYGAPPGWIGRKVRVQWDAMFVRLLDPRTGALLREHLSGKRGAHRIRDGDRPRRTPPQLLQLLARGAVCDAIHARQGELGIRRIQGVLQLQAIQYRFVRRYGAQSPGSSQPEASRSLDPRTDSVSRPDPTTHQLRGTPVMNPIELKRSLVQLPERHGRRARDAPTAGPV